MKNSKDYSRKVQKLYRDLKRQYQKPQKVEYALLLDALVYAIVSENISVAKARSASRKLADYFIDFNDLRVSQLVEIVEVLGGDTAVTRNIASMLTMALGTVFREYNTISLEALKKIGKRPARQVLEKMDGTTSFVVDYCVLTALGGHAIPLTKGMIDYLRNNQLVHPNADQQQIEGFLARQISAKNAYEFYALLRRCSESRRAATKKKKTVTKPKTKAVSKTKKKGNSN